MEHHGSSNDKLSGSGAGAGAGKHPFMSSSDPVNPKRPSTISAPAVTPPQLTLQVEGDVDAPGSSTNSTNTLYSLLKRDIEPRGRRNFVPFFRHYDLLRLSECSKDLMGYHHHLSGILLSNPHPSISGTNDDDIKVTRGIMRLLSAQERGEYGLDCLVIDDPYVLKLLKSMAEGASQCRVKKLLLGAKGADGKDASDTITSAAMRGIEELDLHGWSDWRPVFEALGQGACPRLLCLSLMDPDDNQCEALARALRPGRLHNLQELTIADETSRNNGPGLRLVFEALQEGSCPNLTKIDLGGNDNASILQDDILALADLLRSRACPQLKALVSCAQDMDEEGVVDVMEALLDGNYSHLTHLRFGSMQKGGKLLAMAVARILSSGRYSHLQELRLCGWGYMEEDDDIGLGLTRILEAIGAGYCLELRFLSIAGSAMNNHHARMLGQALGDGACPFLEDLGLEDSHHLDDEGLVHVIDAVEHGACPYLKNISLGGTVIRHMGAALLVQALASESLSHL